MRHSAQPDMKFRHLIILLLCLASFTPMKAQDVAVKTNLLYDAVLTPNIGVEVGVAPKWTIDVTGQLNAWTVNEHYWKHWLAQPEARYWFCQRFAGHFVGAPASLTSATSTYPSISSAPTSTSSRITAIRAGW